jgi:hypothetical protein
MVARGGPGAAPNWEAEAVAARTCGGPVAPSREAGTGASGHMGTRACLVLCLDLELVHGGIRSSGYRQWPLVPLRERLRTRGWGQHPFPV